MLIEISIYNTIDLSFRIIKNEHMHTLYLIYMIVHCSTRYALTTIVHVYPALGILQLASHSVFKDLTGPEVINLVSYSIQLSTKFILFIDAF